MLKEYVGIVWLFSCNYEQEQMRAIAEQRREHLDWTNWATKSFQEGL